MRSERPFMINVVISFNLKKTINTNKTTLVKLVTLDTGRAHKKN